MKHDHAETLTQLKLQMPADSSLQQLTELFKSFGDGTRMKILYALSLSDMFVISSGDYERYFEKDGKTKRVRLYASGGYPKLGTEFIAGESGAELVGTINGKTGQKCVDILS